MVSLQQQPIHSYANYEGKPSVFSNHEVAITLMGSFLNRFTTFRKFKNWQKYIYILMVYLPVGLYTLGKISGLTWTDKNPLNIRNELQGTCRHRRNSSRNLLCHNSSPVHQSCMHLSMYIFFSYIVLNLFHGNLLILACTINPPKIKKIHQFSLFFWRGFSWNTCPEIKILF